ncbi:MAG: hypothetical protein V2A66_08730 [Pseudomonadota bacterium]
MFSGGDGEKGAVARLVRCPGVASRDTFDAVACGDEAARVINEEIPQGGRSSYTCSATPLVSSIDYFPHNDGFYSVNETSAVLVLCTGELKTAPALNK